LDKDSADLIYGICAFEIERTLVPYNTKDALVNAQFEFSKNKHLVPPEKLPQDYQIILNYIEVHRANVKSDKEIIAFHLFYNKFPFWANPTKQQIELVAQNIDTVMGEIKKLLDYKVSKRIHKEIIRQSIPFKILDQVITENLHNAETILDDKAKREEKIEQICNKEYKKNKIKLRTTIIQSIIYLLITKVLIAIIIEIPYELSIEGGINVFNLTVNIAFPILTMFVITSTFSIPSSKNTKVIKQMINAILSADTEDDKAAFMRKTSTSHTFRIIFQAIYFGMFGLIFGGIIYILYLLKFNVPGMIVFMIFFSTIFYFAYRIRNTATELRVMNVNPSIFSPFIDMVSTPVPVLGKALSEGASQLNVLTIFLDFFIEAPFKTIIKVFEEWNNFIRETREEIV
jgi:hypothetical protein